MNKEKIMEFCKAHIIKDYSINEDDNGFYVDVYGSVYLSFKRLKSIPIRFGKVTHDFDCSGNKLTSLEGSPSSVGGSFLCSYNDLTSLEFCPSKVGGSFYCSGNDLSDNSYYHLFDLGYGDTNIKTNYNLLSVRRQWVINNIISN
jgi:hypothetical protein